MILLCRICHTVITTWTPNCLSCGAHCKWDEISPAQARAIQARQARSGSATEIDTDYNGEREAPRPKTLSEIEDQQLYRLATGEESIDRVLGGGWVGGKLYAYRAPNGAAKSRIALRCAARLCRFGHVVYASTSFEEGERDIKRHVRDAKLDKWSHVKSRLHILEGADDPEVIAEAIERYQAVFTVVDSFSTLWKPEVPGDRGSIQQSRFAMTLFREILKPHKPGDWNERAALLGLCHEDATGKKATGSNDIPYFFDTVLQNQRMVWVPPTVGPTGAEIAGRFEPTSEPSEFIRLRSTGKTRDAHPTAFSIFQFTESSVRAVGDAPPRKRRAA